jgi:hypothetical protein
MKTKIGKKSQIHLVETIMVMFVVIALIVLGLTVYFKYSFEKNKDVPYELSERDATILLTKFLSLSEISCDGLDCVDASKFLAIQRVSQDDLKKIQRIFGKKKIVIRRIFPIPDVSEVECDILKYLNVEYPDNCDHWIIYDYADYYPIDESGGIISTPISLYFPETDKYEIGRLEIEHYGKL